MDPQLNDGGPAFPCMVFSGDDHHDPEYACGLTMRDWFAGQALAAMAVAPDYSKGPCNSAMAIRAYLIADHMLAARSSKSE